MADEYKAAPREMKGLYVTLLASDNPYLKYPAEGYLHILEYGVNGAILQAVFAGKVEPGTSNSGSNYGAFHAYVECKNPVFVYHPNTSAYEHFKACLEFEKNKQIS
jgi:hypothetical protein